MEKDCILAGNCSVHSFYTTYHNKNLHQSWRQPNESLYSKILLLNSFLIADEVNSVQDLVNAQVCISLTPWHFKMLKRHLEQWSLAWQQDSQLINIYFEWDMKRFAEM